MIRKWSIYKNLMINQWYCYWVIIYWFILQIDFGRTNGHTLVQCDQKGRCQKYLLITPKIFESQKYFIPFWFPEYLTFMMVCLPNIFFQKKCTFLWTHLKLLFCQTWSFYTLVMVTIFFYFFETFFAKRILQ